MKAYFYFNDGTQTKEISSEIITDSFSSTEIYHNNLKPADNNLSFKIPFETEISNYLKTFINYDVKVQIKEESKNLFTGYLKKSVNFEKAQRNQPISLSVVNPSYFLDITTNKSIAMLNKSVSDIIRYLLELADFKEIGSTLAISDRLSYFALEEGANIKTTISELCYEYGYTFYFDNEGLFQIYPLFSDIPADRNTIKQKFDGTNIREKIKITAKEHEADYVEAKYNKVDFFTNTLLFEDTQNADKSNKCLIEVLPNAYVFDEEKNNLDYDNTNGDVLYVKSITPQVKYDNGLSFSLSRFDEDGNDLLTSARMVCKNPTSKSLFIRQLDIYGDAFICSSYNSVVSSTGTKKKEIELKYIYNEEKASEFALNLANYYRYSNFTIQLKSQTDYKLGSFVSVEDYGTGKFYGRITKKEKKLSEKSYSYTIETINDFEPAVIEKTQATVSQNRNSVRRGKDGTSFYTWIKYADTPTSGMSDNPEGKDYIGLAFNRVSQKESDDYSDYAWTLIKGTNGKNGIDGTNGKTLYTWIKYADTISGVGMSDDGTDKQFIGIAYNKETAQESTNPKDYTWSLFRGKNGVDGSDGKSNIMVELSNANVSVSANSSGVAYSYNRTPTEIHVYEGVRALKYSDKATTEKGFWWCSISTSGFSSGGKTLKASADGFYATLGNCSTITASTYSGRRTITINGITTQGETFTRVAQQTITLVLSGEDANALQITPEIVNLCCGLDGTLFGDYNFNRAIKVEMRLVKNNKNESFTYTLSNVPDRLELREEKTENNITTLTFEADRGSYVPTTEIKVEAVSGVFHYYKTIKIVVSDCGRYLGRLDVPPDNEQIGDYFLFDGSSNDDSFTVGSIYCFDGSEWCYDSNDNHTVAGFSDAIEMAEELNDNSRYTGVFKRLTTAVLQVGKMFANQITLMNNGLIQSSNYSATTGFQIKANGDATFRNGIFNNIKSDNGTFTNATIEESCIVKGLISQGTNFFVGTKIVIHNSGAKIKCSNELYTTVYFYDTGILVVKVPPEHREYGIPRVISHYASDVSVSSAGDPTLSNLKNYSPGSSNPRYQLNVSSGLNVFKFNSDGTADEYVPIYFTDNNNDSYITPVYAILTLFYV